MTSGSSLGLYINPRAGACRRREEGRRSVLIRQSGSLPRPRRTGAAGRTAALATGWPFQRPAAAGLWTQGGARRRLKLVFQRKLCANAISQSSPIRAFRMVARWEKPRAPRLGPRHSGPLARPARLWAAPRRPPLACRAPAGCPWSWCWNWGTPQSSKQRFIVSIPAVPPWCSEWVDSGCI